MTFKPTRGPQKPSFKLNGINQFQLVHFLEDCQKRLEREGETDSAFRFEMVKEFIKQDYKPGESLKFKPTALGL